VSNPEIPQKPKGPRTHLSPSFGDWMTKRLGIRHSLLRCLGSDDDWSFVIKMHALVEAGVNHLLLVQMNNPKLFDVIRKYPLNRKMEFIRAYSLLTEDCCLFVRSLSEIRNDAVHDAKNFNLDLQQHIESAIKNPNQRQTWQRAFSCFCVRLPKPSKQHKEFRQRMFDEALDDPRNSIFACCTFILTMARAGEANLGYKRANNQKIILGALRFINDVIASCHGLGFLVHVLLSRRLFIISHETFSGFLRNTQ
jgi:hypothetical protein